MGISCIKGRQVLVVHFILFLGNYLSIHGFHVTFTIPSSVIMGVTQSSWSVSYPIMVPQKFKSHSFNHPFPSVRSVSALLDISPHCVKDRRRYRRFPTLPYPTTGRLPSDLSLLYPWYTGTRLSGDTGLTRSLNNISFTLGNFIKKFVS